MSSSLFLVKIKDETQVPKKMRVADEIAVCLRIDSEQEKF
jgi:hypothetical protein